MEKINEQELREYIDILIDEFGFTITEIAQGAEIARATLSSWKNNPNGGIVFAERLAKLNSYVMYVLYGDGLQDRHDQAIAEAEERLNQLVIKRDELKLKRKRNK